jgi:hypothetical protein
MVLEWKPLGSFLGLKFKALCHQDVVSIVIVLGLVVQLEIYQIDDSYPSDSSHHCVSHSIFNILICPHIFMIIVILPIRNKRC